MAMIEFEMTDFEVMIFEHIAADPQDWIENAVRHQIELAKDEVVEMQKAKMLADPNCQYIPADRDQICLLADLKSAASRMGIN